VRGLRADNLDIEHRAAEALRQIEELHANSRRLSHRPPCAVPLPVRGAVVCHA
jgi:hypothetical protein